MKYLFIEGEELYDRNVNIVIAENLDKAKEYYAKFHWNNDNFIQEDIETKTVNMSFWEPYFIDMFDEQGICLVDQKTLYDNFKANLKEDFNEEVAEELYNFFTNEDRNNYNSLSRETKFAVALHEVENRLEDGWLEARPLDQINKITKDYSL